MLFVAVVVVGSLDLVWYVAGSHDCHQLGSFCAISGLTCAALLAVWVLAAVAHVTCCRHRRRRAAGCCEITSVDDTSDWTLWALFCFFRQRAAGASASEHDCDVCDGGGGGCGGGDAYD